MAARSSTDSNSTASYRETLVDALDKKFVCQGKSTYFKSGKSKEMSLFMDGILKIKGKVEGSRQAGFYLMSISNRETTKEICLPMHSFNDVNKFLSTINEEFGGGDFICGGMVKTKDIKDYIVWLKDSYYQSGEMRKLLPAPHVGFIKERQYWLLSNELHLNNTGFIEKANQEYYMLGESFKGFYLEIDKNLVNDFRYFKTVFKRVIEDSKSFKNNKDSFLMSMAFVLKSYVNNYHVDRCDTGETRFCLLFSDDMSTGKTSAMLSLCYGQGASSDSSMMLSAGDGRVVGTTVKPLRDIMQKTNLFIFMNDYTQSKTLDEFLLHAHEGYSQGSGSSGINLTKAAVLITANKEESKRLIGRLMRIVFQRSAEFSASDANDLEEFKKFAQSNKGFLIGWCHHFAAVWFEDATQEFISLVDDFIKKSSSKIQGRYSKSWASTVTAYIFMHYSVRIDVNIKEIVSSVLDLVKTECCQFGKLTGVDDIEENLLNGIENDSAENISAWLKIGTSFTDKNGKDIQAISIDGRKLGSNLFPEVNTRTLSAEMIEKFGKNCHNTVDFKSTIRAKAYKIPEAQFRESTLKKLYQVFGKTRDGAMNEETSVMKVTDEDFLLLEEKSLTLKQIIGAVIRDKQGYPTVSNTSESRFIQELTPDSRRYYTGISPRSKTVFKMGRASTKVRRVLDVEAQVDCAENVGQKDSGPTQKESVTGAKN